jgi:hypothetical protein
MGVIGLEFDANIADKPSSYSDLLYLSLIICNQCWKYSIVTVPCFVRETF